MTAPIVVGVDAAPASGDAMLWALAEARRRDTWLLLLHAADAADAVVAAAAGVSVSTRAAGLIRAHRRVAQRMAPDVRVLGQVAGGAAAQVLANVSRRADLLVVGSRGRLGMTESALGSIGQQVVAHAHCPVVVVSPGCSRLVTRRIAVGIAEPTTGQPVLDFAAAEAQRWGAVLCLVRADADASTGATAYDLGVAADYVRRHYPQVVVERVTARDAMVPALIAESARADLLVLGCRHTEQEFGSRMGAVPAGVLPLVSCPVALIARAPLAAVA